MMPSFFFFFFVTLIASILKAASEEEDDQSGFGGARMAGFVLAIAPRPDVIDSSRINLPFLLHRDCF